MKADQRSLDDVRKIVQMNVMLLSDYGADKLLIWCQKCCIWCCYHQMHWRLNVMLDMLHPIVKRSDARWRLSVAEVVRTVAFDLIAIRWEAVDVRIAAFDRDEVRCTLTVVWLSELHLISMSSDALTIENDVSTAAFDAEIIKCTNKIVWLSDCCIRSWNDQMHADDCLKKLSELHLMSMSSDALTIVCWCQKNCIWFRTIKCTDEVVCFVVCYRTIK